MPKTTNLTAKENNKVKNKNQNNKLKKDLGQKLLLLEIKYYKIELAQI